ncbi:MAG: hypothetical protein A2138_01105 [Deltaproteobacteria bacterium RBG_16_71_12]|nr:MAG: hypothetical protein A2138_01105 [Deltaproteobacteria bacterium RBG_16_71_12]
MVRRGFAPASLTPGELVAVTRDGGLQVARVEAIDGASVSLDLGAGALLQIDGTDVIGRAVRARR